FDAPGALDQDIRLGAYPSGKLRGEDGAARRPEPCRPFFDYRTLQLRHAGGGSPGPRAEWKYVDKGKATLADQIEDVSEHPLALRREPGNQVAPDHHFRTQ